MRYDRFLSVSEQPSPLRFDLTFKNGEADLTDSQFSVLKRVFLSNLTRNCQSDDFCHARRMHIEGSSVNDLRRISEISSLELGEGLRGFKMRSVTASFKAYDRVFCLDDLFKISSPFASVKENIGLLSRYIKIDEMNFTDIDKKEKKIGEYRFKDVPKNDIFRFLFLVFGNNANLFIVINDSKNIELLNIYNAYLESGRVSFGLILI